MEFKQRSAYRGDTRAPSAVDEAGGFVPKYLIRHHAGGEQGFYACTNKVQGKMGCHCPGFSEHTLFAKARSKFIDLLKKPIDLQNHVMYNADGFLSSTVSMGEQYDRGSAYSINAWLYEYSLEEAVKKFGEGAIKLPQLVLKWKVYTDESTLALSELLAITPAGDFELTFISPVRARYLASV